VQTFAALALRFAPGGETPPLHLATPAFARWRSACTCRVLRGRAKANADKEPIP